MTEPEPTPEITAQELVNAFVNAFTVVLPAIHAQAAVFAQAVDRFADAVARLEAVEYHRRTGRKPTPRPVPRPKGTDR